MDDITFHTVCIGFENNKLDCVLCQIFAHGSFPEVGQKQKTEERERKKERLDDGNNNG